MGFSYQEVLPGPGLESIVKNYFIITYDDKEEKQDFLLPNGTPSFFYIMDPDYCSYGKFMSSDKVYELSNAFYAGYGKTLLQFSHKRLKIIGATTYPYFLRKLFGLNPVDLLDNIIDVNSIPGSEGALNPGDGSSNHIIKELNKYFHEKLIKENYQNEFAPVYQELNQPGGYKKNLKEVADSLGYSYRYLSTMFNRHLGLSPKQFVRLIRFNSALQMMDMMDSKKNLSEIAHKLGYHDQAHFIRDVKNICGRTPKQLSESSGALADKFRLFKNS